MILVCAAVRDSALSAFSRPWFVPTTGGAQRAFSDEINNSQGDLFRHPEDYELYELGTWDDATARFSMLDEPRLIIRGKDVFRNGKDS